MSRAQVNQPFTNGTPPSRRIIENDDSSTKMLRQSQFKPRQKAKRRYKKYKQLEPLSNASFWRALFADSKLKEYNPGAILRRWHERAESDDQELCSKVFQHVRERARKIAASVIRSGAANRETRIDEVVATVEAMYADPKKRATLFEYFPQTCYWHSLEQLRPQSKKDLALLLDDLSDVQAANALLDTRVMDQLARDIEELAVLSSLPDPQRGAATMLSNGYEKNAVATIYGIPPRGLKRWLVAGREAGRRRREDQA